MGLLSGNGTKEQINFDGKKYSDKYVEIFVTLQEMDDIVKDFLPLLGEDLYEAGM